ncbi:MAG: orotate phosphoribosyltransferase [bacterium]|nr:orotate phosphoribosyltransferase [bacterium]
MEGKSSLTKVPLSLKFGDFTLKSGEKSPFYLDLRLLRSFPELLHAGANILYKLTVQGPPFDRIADVPTAATPFVAVISVLYNLPMISPREAKGHGTQATIEGVYHAGMKVRLIDDLITKATSKLESISALKSRGLIVEEVCVIIDREQGGREELAKAGYSLQAAFTARELIERCYRTGAISGKQFAEVMSYLDSQVVK